MNAREMMYDSRPLLLDGAMGTLLMSRLPGYTGCIELLNLERPDLVLEIHRAYAESGALIITTNTFGGNGLKLSEYGLAERVRDINGTAARLAKESVAGKDALVAGCIGPSGRLLEPAGPVSAAEMAASFTEQAAVLAESGVDMFVIETMGDLLEAQTAVRAVRAVSALPLVCNLTFEQNGKTVSGTDMFTGLATLSQSGADVVGANCSMGPEGLLKLFSENMSRLETLGVPLSVWANAGLPEIRDGRAVYSLSPERFAALSVEFALMGMKIIGGCCGTTPAHIEALAKLLENVQSKNRAYRKRYSYITSRFTALDTGSPDGLIVIGERLNPTARKKFAEELKTGATGFLREESKKQEAEGARVLDITDLENPSEIGFFTSTGTTRRIYIRDHYAFLANYGGGLRIFDISNPRQSSESGYFKTSSAANDLALDSQFIYVVGDEDGLYMIEFVPPTRVPDRPNSSQLTAFHLEQNFPNPFNPETQIRFTTAEAGRVNLVVFNLAGQVVATLVNHWLPAGTHRVVWQILPEKVSSGIYFYKIVAGDFWAMRKCLVVK